MIKNKIIHEIKRKGKISIERFTEICLFDKKGFYSNSNPIGKSGNFITAPEISQLFGEILGLYIHYIWKTKHKSKFNLIELGPGRGTLLIDILRITKFFLKFHNYINVHLVERNNFLLKIQKQNLIKNNFEKLKHFWHKKFSNIDQKPSIIIANEFFDCLPTKQFQKINNKWYEKMINYNEKSNIFFYENLIVSDKKLLKELTNYQNNEIVEISKQREMYFKILCKYILKNLGTIIIIDYGYLDPPNNFTLQSYFNNKKSNCLDNLGNQDITSLVDFKKLINIAKDYKLNIESYSNQKDFLLNHGIVERKNKILRKCNFNQKKIIESGFERLIDNNKMGLVFKFLILSNYNFNEKY